MPDFDRRLREQFGLVPSIPAGLWHGILSPNPIRPKNPSAFGCYAHSWRGHVDRVPVINVVVLHEKLPSPRVATRGLNDFYLMTSIYEQSSRS